MPNIYFTTFELLMYALLGLCATHAWRKGGPPGLWRLLAGVGFGVLLEWATIQQLHAYEYGRFWVMLGQVPLAIGVGWGVIIYSVRLFSDATNLPRWARPILDGLLALNIDLAMDAVAIRLGFWDWGQGLAFEWWGVPYANFWAWFWVVFSFSAGLRLLTRRGGGFVARWLAPAGAIVVGVAGVLATNRLIVSLHPYNVYEETVALTLITALALVVWLRPKQRGKLAAPAVWVPLGFHAFFLVGGLASGTLFNPPFLLVPSLAMALVALSLHRGNLLPTEN